MIKHDKSGGKITFRQHAGNGDYDGCEFDLGVTCTPDGTITGMPVVSIRDENRTTVTFELSDIVPMAFLFAEKDVDLVAELKDLVYGYSECALRESCEGCGYRNGPAGCGLEDRALAIGAKVVEV